MQSIAAHDHGFVTKTCRVSNTLFFQKREKEEHLIVVYIKSTGCSLLFGQA